MFKVGQVWRANASGNTYLVLSVPNSHRATVARMTGPAKGQKGWIGVSAAQRRYTLIGNNYQELLPKQAQPGTAFKRWLSDMTGDLPEQRGCRKEDC